MQHRSGLDVDLSFLLERTKVLVLWAERKYAQQCLQNTSRDRAVETAIDSATPLLPDFQVSVPQNPFDLCTPNLAPTFRLYLVELQSLFLTHPSRSHSEFRPVHQVGTGENVPDLFQVEHKVEAVAGLRVAGIAGCTERWGGGVLVGSLPLLLSHFRHDQSIYPLRLQAIL